MRYSWNIFKSILLTLLLLLAISGCLGPMGLSVTRKHYNDAIITTNVEETLLNIVRLRYLDQPMNLPVSGVTSQFEINASSDLRVGDDGANFLSLFGGNVGFSDRPTVVFNPVANQANSQLYFQPIGSEELHLLAESFSVGRIFRLFVNQVNGLPNAPTADGPTPPNPPIYEEFRHVTELVTALQRQNAILIPFEERQEDITELVPIESLSTDDIIKLKQNGFGIRKAEEDGGKYRLTQSRKVQKFQIRVAPDTFDMTMRLTQLLRLDPSTTKYDVRYISGEFPLRLTQSPELRRDLTVTPRSLAQTLFFMSHGVRVPHEHVNKGWVKVTINPDGTLFDWGKVLENVIEVRCCKHRPRNAYSAVRYRGYWFYVAKDDTDSITTLLVYNAALRLLTIKNAGQNSGAPILTLPVGG